MIDYRTAHLSDAPELKELNDLLNGEGCNKLEAIEASLQRNEQEIVCVAVNGHKLVGFCCSQLLKSMCYPYNYAEITELYIINEYRRKGIGKHLLQYCENLLIKRDVRHFHVLTGSKNAVAQTLYRSNGYNDTSEILFDKNINNTAR